MPRPKKRKTKRVKKGVESLRKQVEKHREKLREAIESRRYDLVDYYTREIERKESDQLKKEKHLQKGKKKII